MHTTAIRTLLVPAFALTLLAGVWGCGPPATTAAPGAETTPGPTATPATAAPRPAHTAAPERPAVNRNCSVERAGTGPKDTSGHVDAELYLVRVERDRCADRVVFRLNGPARAGGHAEYVTAARGAQSGDPIQLAGSAVLEIVVYAPDFSRAGSGHQPGRTPWTIGQAVADVPSGWPTLREVKYAGPNDGSETVFAVGVGERRPFRIVQRPGTSYSQLVVEIAHR